MPTQFTNLFKSWKQITISVLVVIYIAINLFRIGGAPFIINLNNFIVIPLAIGTTFFAWTLWRQIKSGSQNQLLWLGLTIGWAMWTIAELWWAIASLLSQEVPYPSWADFFWLVGYIPMYFALWERQRLLPKVITSAQRTVFWVLALAILGFTILFILLPIILQSDPSAIIESVISLLYPIADTILLILVLRLLFSYQQGMYGRAWQWITSGFILFALGDLLFAYASTINMYYPEQQVNLISTIGVDIPYNLSYLVWIVGLYLLQNLLKTYQPFIGDVKKLALVPNTHLLVFTKGDDTVMDVSKNYERVFSVNMEKGKTIQEVLGISPEDADTILKDSKANKIFKERKFLVNTRLGQEQAWISGIVIFNPQGEYSGVYLLLRMLAKDYSLDKLLTDHEKAMANSILSKTGTKQKEEEEIKQLLANYYLAYLQALYNRVFTEGGSIMTDIFFTELQSVSKQHTWQMEIQPDNLLDVSALSLSETQEALPILLETAKQFVIEITDESSVNTIVQDVRSKFDEFTLENISHFELVKQDRT